MPRTSFVPHELRKGPFTLAEAARAGVTRHQLQSGGYRRIIHGFYAWAELPNTPDLLLASVHRRLPPPAAFSGATAAWLHDLGLPIGKCVEVTIDEGSPVAARAGLQVTRTALDPKDMVPVRGLPTTAVLRTVADLGRAAPLIDAVVAADVALNRGLITAAQLRDSAALTTRSKGRRRLRRLIELAEPLAESPMETRLRLLLIFGGLPRPEAQASLRDGDGELVGRADLFYRDRGLVIEYDGDGHRSSLSADNRRQNRLLGAGYTILRFTAPDIYRSPETVVGQVRHSLALAS